jgi:hypothetical protein
MRRAARRTPCVRARRAARGRPTEAHSHLGFQRFHLSFELVHACAEHLRVRHGGARRPRRADQAGQEAAARGRRRNVERGAMGTNNFKNLAEQNAFAALAVAALCTPA